MMSPRAASTAKSTMPVPRSLAPAPPVRSLRLAAAARRARPLDELSYALDELGSDGITIETNSAGVYLGDHRYEPLYRELNRRRAVVFVHPTSPPCAETIALGRPRPMLEFIVDTTRAVSDLVFTGTLVRYPDIEWVFTHGGGALPLLAERMELFRTVLLGDDDPRSAVPRQLRRLWFDIAGTPVHASRREGHKLWNTKLSWPER